MAKAAKPPTTPPTMAPTLAAAALLPGSAHIVALVAPVPQAAVVRVFWKRKLVWLQPLAAALAASTALKLASVRLLMAASAVVALPAGGTMTGTR